MGRISSAEVYAALDTVIDPELGIDVVNLGLVYDVTIADGQIVVTMTLTTMGCPAQADIERAAREAVAALAGVEQVDVRWTFDPPWTPERLSEEGRDMLLSLGYL